MVHAPSVDTSFATVYLWRMDYRPSRGTHRFESARIVVFATFAAVVYGVLHDQVTAHLCVEYFTIAHPPTLSSNSPFWLGIVWGIIATWWVGLILGIGLALAARAGSAPRVTLEQLKRPIFMLMLVSGVCALAAGLVGAALTAVGVVPILGGWGALIPPGKHVAFSADAWAHTASYIAGTVGGLSLIVCTAIRRRLAEADQSEFKPFERALREEGPKQSPLMRGVGASEGTRAD